MFDQDSASTNQLFNQFKVTVIVKMKVLIVEFLQLGEFLPSVFGSKQIAYSVWLTLNSLCQSLFLQSRMNLPFLVLFTLSTGFYKIAYKIKLQV